MNYMRAVPRSVTGNGRRIAPYVPAHILYQFYICGGNHVATAARDAGVRIVAETRSISQDEALEVFQKIQTERFSTDVFG